MELIDTVRYNSVTVRQIPSLRRCPCVARPHLYICSIRERIVAQVKIQTVADADKAVGAVRVRDDLPFFVIRRCVIMIPLEHIRTVCRRTVVDVQVPSGMQRTDNIVLIVNTLHDELLIITAAGVVQHHICAVLRTRSFDIQHIAVISTRRDIPYAVQSYCRWSQQPLLRVSAICRPRNERSAVVIRAVWTVEMQIVALRNDIIAGAVIVRHNAPQLIYLIAVDHAGVWSMLYDPRARTAACRTARYVQIQVGVEEAQRVIAIAHILYGDLLPHDILALPHHNARAFFRGTIQYMDGLIFSCL